MTMGLPRASTQQQLEKRLERFSIERITQTVSKLSNFQTAAPKLATDLRVGAFPVFFVLATEFKRQIFYAHNNPPQSFLTLALFFAALS
jgi:hypothetical protein